jgi:hypothetical protein
MEPQTYNGQGFPNGTMDYIRDMYTLLRQDASFDDKWIIGSPLANKGLLPTNCCSEWVDFGDMHPYPFNGNYLANTWQSYGNITRYFYNSNQVRGVVIICCPYVADLVNLISHQ